MLTKSPNKKKLNVPHLANNTTAPSDKAGSRGVSRGRQSMGLIGEGEVRFENMNRSPNRMSMDMKMMNRSPIRGGMAMYRQNSRSPMGMAQGMAGQGMMAQGMAGQGMMAQGMAGQGMMAQGMAGQGMGGPGMMVPVMGAQVVMVPMVPNRKNSKSPIKGGYTKTTTTTTTRGYPNGGNKNDKDPNGKQPNANGPQGKSPAGRRTSRDLKGTHPYGDSPRGKKTSSRNPSKSPLREQPNKKVPDHFKTTNGEAYPEKPHYDAVKNLPKKKQPSKSPVGGRVPRDNPEYKTEYDRLNKGKPLPEYNPDLKTMRNNLDAQKTIKSPQVVQTVYQEHSKAILNPRPLVKPIIPPVVPLDSKYFKFHDETNYNQKYVPGKPDRENVTPPKDNLRVIPNQSIGPALYKNNFKQKPLPKPDTDLIYQKQLQDNQPRFYDLKQPEHDTISRPAGFKQNLKDRSTSKGATGRNTPGQSSITPAGEEEYYVIEEHVPAQHTTNTGHMVIQKSINHQIANQGEDYIIVEDNSPAFGGQMVIQQQGLGGVNMGGQELYMMEHQVGGQNMNMNQQYTNYEIHEVQHNYSPEDQ